MRVPTITLFRMALTDLNDISADNARLLKQSGTGMKLLKPSDDPGAAVAQLRIKRQQSDYNNSSESLQSGVDRLRTAELAVGDANSILQRAKELSIEGASSAHSAADFAAITAEADQLINEMLSVGNRQVNGRYIFAGNKTGTRPFVATGSPPTAVTYNGDTGIQTVSPSTGVNIGTTLPGSTAFATGATGDAFAALIAFRDAAKTGNVQVLSTTVAQALDDASDNISTMTSKVGAAAASLTRTVDTLASASVETAASLSKVEDADMVQTIVDLQNNQARHQAALSAAAKVVQPTLFDKMA
ncbi:MAG: flagellar hook-associated protein FlgL [Armatimonadetes bacterium]|nr:flagellar hook-associated protein FlgL [Armatimonadota bacterium]